MNDQNREYDAFGPWILEINDVYTMPRLFAPYYKKSQKPIMIFKIPRDIERRNANPSMDLYDYVVALFDTYLYFLQRNGSDVLEYTIAYSDIQAVRYSYDILLGKIHFFIPGKTITIRYNTVSDNIVEKMAAILAEKVSAKENAAYRMDALPYSFNTVEFLYANLINNIRRLEPSAKLAAYQPVATFKRKIRGLGFLKIPTRLQSMAFIVKPAEMIVIGRLKPLRFIKNSQLSYSFLRLPYHAIEDIGLHDETDHENLNVLRIATADHEFSFLYEKSNNRLNSLYQKLRGAAI